MPKRAPRAKDPTPIVVRTKALDDDLTRLVGEAASDKVGMFVDGLLRGDDVPIDVYSTRRRPRYEP